MNANEPPANRTASPCQLLRSKEMYYQAYGQADDECSSGIYWCLKTHENYGPDGEPCGRGECVPGRKCHQG